MFAAGILLFAPVIFAQAPKRILQPIDDRATVRLTGNVHPLARAEFDAGRIPANEPMQQMILVLTLDSASQAELDALTEAQLDPSSPEYHAWLTPEEYGRRFGIASEDLDQISGWLRAHGFQIEEVPNGARTVLLSGTVGEVEETFHTQMRYYRVGGALHRANATEPEIPAALFGIVAGVASLHDFESAHGLAAVRPVSQPELTSGSTHYIAPADFATIYDFNPLYSSSIDGTGQTIAVVARSNINMSDVETFRSLMGLPVNNPVVVLNGANPGVLAGGEQGEATLDAEWAGAIAKKATVKFVVSASTASTDGVNLSAQYVVSHNLAPVVTTSFGMCEQAAGSAYAQFWNGLWQQAAAQGITALVAVGDNGAAGCDDPDETTATGPLGVNVIASSPYDIGVGGTQFNDSSNTSQYWSPSTSSGNLGSALTYIPEAVWNQSGSVSGGTDLWAGSGGASVIYPKPSWQSGTGVPSDNHRHLPDVSIAASTHDGYLICMDGGLYIAGGTSASSPSWAGVIALADQQAGASQGNANATLYPLLQRQLTGGAAVFHDITSGNNNVPGLAGFTAGTGYDQASGLGTPDAMMLVHHWSDVAAPSAAPSLTLSLASSSASVAAGSSAQVQLSTTIGGGFKSAVTLSVSGLPKGLTATWSPATIASPGAGSSTLTLAAASNTAAGSYTLTVTAAGDGVTQTASLTAKVTPAPSFQLGLSKATLSVTASAKSTITVTVSPENGFSGSVALAVTGLPAGVTAAFSPASVKVSSAVTSTLTITTASTAKLTTTNLTVTGTGGGITATSPLALTVQK